MLTSFRHVNMTSILATIVKYLNSRISPHLLIFSSTSGAPITTSPHHSFFSKHITCSYRSLLLLILLLIILLVLLVLIVVQTTNVGGLFGLIENNVTFWLTLWSHTSILIPNLAFCILITRWIGFASDKYYIILLLKQNVLVITDWRNTDKDHCCMHLSVACIRSVWIDQAWPRRYSIRCSIFSDLLSNIETVQLGLREISLTLQ